MDMDMMRSLLACPICLQVSGGKIFLCDNSHKICETCFNKLVSKKCPQGKCPYKSPEPFRSREAEEMIEKCGLSLVCKYGCKEVMKKSEMMAHEKVCPNRVVTCIHNEECGAIKMAELSEHLVNRHSSEIFFEGGESKFIREGSHFHEGIMNMKNGDWTFDQWIYDSRRFYVSTMKQNNVWYMWVYVHGDAEVAKKYGCKITVSKPGTPFKIDHVCQVLSIDVRRSQIANTGHYLSMTNDQAKVLVSPCRKEEKRNRGMVLMFHREIEILKL